MHSMRFSKIALLALLALFPTCAPGLPTFIVNSEADFPDNIFDGVCADAFGIARSAPRSWRRTWETNPQGT